jgi:hypothetical protein
MDVGAVLRKGAHDKRLHTSELAQTTCTDGARWGRRAPPSSAAGTAPALLFVDGLVFVVLRPAALVLRQRVDGSSCYKVGLLQATGKRCTEHATLASACC